MRKSEYPPSITDEVSTYYLRPFLDRITGRYTVEWRDQRIQVHTRFQDFEGYWPSIRSILYLPRILVTYLLSRRQPILKRPTPFLSTDAVSFLDSIALPNMRVLELGGGNSTLWFLIKGVEITTIEHSREWASHVLDHIANSMDLANQKRLHLHTMEGKETIAFIESLPDNSQDIILVDCDNTHTKRTSCIQAAISKVRKGGWLVLDNSDAPVNWAGVDLMSDRNRIRFTGYTYMSLNVTQTSFWQM